MPGCKVTVIFNEALNISHDFSISLVCVGSHFEQVLAMFRVDARRLGMENEGYCEKTLEG